MNDKIRELQKQIEAEKRKVANCKHDFDSAFFNPETIAVPYGSKMEHSGSDVWFVPAGYREEQKDRWSRKCKICGFEQHTYKQKPIVAGNEPSFE
jgi:hypothetical protein